ncbi:MAG: hypothetical protein ACRERU_22590 [Methylococcales bacterium]
MPILDEIRKASETSMTAKALCANVNARLDRDFGKRMGDCRAYDLSLETEVVHAGWYYLLIGNRPADQRDATRGVLFVAPGIVHSPTVTVYFDGGKISESITKITKPAVVEMRRGQARLTVVTKGSIETSGGLPGLPDPSNRSTRNSSY